MRKPQRNTAGSGAVNSSEKAPNSAVASEKASRSPKAAADEAPHPVKASEDQTMDIIPLPTDRELASSSDSDALSRVLYIGHLPHGFYEKQLLGFFSQFGKLTRIRLSRNKKTAKAKHYAFLEFQYSDVAKIAADAMDGYFMFAQKLSVRCLKQSEVHPELFKGGNRKFKAIPWRKIAMERVNKERTPAEHAKRVARLIMKDRRRQRKIAAAGIDFEYEPLSDKLPAQAQKKSFDD